MNTRLKRKLYMTVDTQDGSIYIERGRDYARDSVRASGGTLRMIELPLTASQAKLIDIARSAQ